MRFEIYRVGEGIPETYETYSALLIPHFFGASGDSLWPLIARYKAFGDVFGSNHCAYWLYHKGFIGIANQIAKVHVDLVHDALASASPANLYSLIKAAGVSVQFTASDLEAENGYDFKRAKHYCDAMNLHYKNGPYIAFFNAHPRIPRFFMTAPYSFALEECIPTLPSYVLTFGGVDTKSSMNVMQALEVSLRRHFADGRVTAGVHWQQCWDYITQWCSDVKEPIATGIQVIPRDKLPIISH
jgi:hypothetical protein